MKNAFRSDVGKTETTSADGYGATGVAVVGTVVIGGVAVGAFSSGARRRDVQSAVEILDRHGSPDAVILAAAQETARNAFKDYQGHLARLSTPTRLAVEMALHEEEERRALQGELWLLERRWKKAEEIAGIADDLLPPDGAEAFVTRHRPGPEG